MRHLLEIDDLDGAEVEAVLDRAEQADPPAVLSGAGMALLFEKPSARTRNSMEMATVQLGGHPVTIRGDEVGLGTRETPEDLARTLGCYHAAIGARVFAHSTVERMAAASTVPVVCLLSDDAHPLQALADLLTIRQTVGKLEGVTVAYIGDGNNVCRSLCLAGALTGMTMKVSSPPGHRLSGADLDRIGLVGRPPSVFDRPAEAVEGADVVYTDVWASMGQEAEADQRRRAFEGFTVDAALLDHAPGAVFLHCLPAHRGEEVSAEVIDGDRSLVWQQAENRMHSARGLLVWLAGR